MNKSKKGKSKTVWVCDSCGHSEGQWWGSCRACHKVGTMKRFTEGSASSASGGGGSKATGSSLYEGSGLSWLPEQAVGQPHRLTDVIHGITKQQWRFSLYVRICYKKNNFDAFPLFFGVLYFPGSIVWLYNTVFVTPV